MVGLVGGRGCGCGCGCDCWGWVGEEEREEREERVSRGVTWMLCHRLTVILMSFDLFIVISYENDLSEL